MRQRDRQGRRWQLFGILAIVLLSAAVNVAAEEVVLPHEVFFYHPVASVDGQNAAWINPAALGYANNGSILIFTQRQRRLVRDYGGAAVMRVVSFAYRKINRDNASDHEEIILAAGAGGHTKFGFSYRYIKHGEGYLNKRHLWNLGLLIAESPNATLGARVENLNRSPINGKKSDMRYVYGIAVNLYRTMVKGSFEVGMTQKESLNAADFRTGFEVNPVPGLLLYLDFDNHSRINLGFRMNFGMTYAGHYHNFDRNFNSVMGTTYVGSVDYKQPSIKLPGFVANPR
jgi:hypothetical protein